MKSEIKGKGDYMYLTKKKVKSDLNINDICIYISDRSGRKTSVIQDVMLELWKKENYKPIFALLRTKTDENVTESWFSDYILKKYNSYKFYHKKINNYITVICAEVDGEEQILCFNFFVSVSQKYKSSYYQGFESLKYIIWEECIPENRLTQNIEIIERSDEMLNKIFSIASTVCRDSKPKFIFLGNDIKYNFLNPITVKFKLLDKVKINTDVTGDIGIYNDNYHFNFYYFDFPKSVNHWVGITDLTFIKDFSSLGEKLPFIFLLNGKKYFLYENNININVVENDNIDYIDEKKVLNKFFTDSVCEQCLALNLSDKQVLLELLRLKNSAFNAIFNLYYDNVQIGNNIVYQYHDKTQKQKPILLDLEQILNDFNYTEILESCAEIYEFFKLKFLKKRMYSDFAIKTNFEKFIDLLLKTFIDFK